MSVGARSPWASLCCREERIWLRSNWCAVEVFARGRTLYRARFAVESGWRQRREWNGEWSGVGIGILRSSWDVRPCDSGLAGRNVTGVHEGMDGSNGVLAVRLANLSVWATCFTLEILLRL